MVLNTLVAVLVEAVQVVSSVEKERTVVTLVRDTLQSTLSKLDQNRDNMISRAEFELLLVRPDCAQALADLGVDVVGLVDCVDYIFMGGEDMSFRDFMDMILQLRGNNKATVKDVVDLRKYLVVQLERAMARTH